MKCKYCKGKGKILDFLATLKMWKGRIMTNDDLNVMKKCTRCNGTGEQTEKIR